MPARINPHPERLRWNAPDLRVLDAPVEIWLECTEGILRQDHELAPGVSLFEQSLTGAQAHLEYAHPQRQVVVKLDMQQEDDGLRIDCTVANTGEEPLHLRRVIVILADPGTLDEPASSSDWRLYVDSGSNAWCGVKRLDATRYDPNLLMVETQRVFPVSADVDVASRFHSSSMMTTLWDAATWRAFLFGFLSLNTVEPFVEVVPDRSGQRITAVRACAIYDADLAPGAMLIIDPFVIAAGHDPLELMERYATAVHAHLQAGPASSAALPQQPVAGYMSWYGYGTAITEQIIRDNARVCRDIFGGYPQPMRQIMLIDHGWQWRANWGKWDETDPRRFPSGMAVLAAELKELGLELGLWYTPFCVTDDEPNQARLQPLLTTDEHGQPITSIASVWGYNPEETVATRTIHFLDSALPGTLNEIRSNLRRMKDWGASFWKLDFFAVMTSAHRQSQHSSAAMYHAVHGAIQSVLGPDDLVMPCSTQTNQLLGKCNLINIPCDTGNASMWPSHKDAFRRSYESTAAAWYKHGTFWNNDNQSVQIGEGCSQGEARIRATHIAMSGAGCWLSEDVTELPPDRLFMVQRILPAVGGKAARPLDLFERVYPDQSPRLWALPVKTDWDEWTAVAVFNFDTTPFTTTLIAETFGITAGAPFEAMEWWTSRRLGQHTGGLTVHVPPEDVVILLAKPLRATPWLLGTDLHFTGGWIVEHVAWDAERLVLSGDVITKTGLRGNLYGMLPAGLTIKPAVTQAARDNGSQGWHMRIETTGLRTHFEVPFAAR